MRKTMKKIALLALALMLCTNAMASMITIDKGRQGSVTLLIQTSTGVVVPNAIIDLYHVGEPVFENSNLQFELADDFAGSGLSLDDLSAPGLVDELAKVAGEPMDSQVTGEDGVVKFDKLNMGLYMVMQSGFTEEMYFTRIMPFLVAVPMTSEDGEGWDYAIDASPKVVELPRPTASPEPTPKPEPTEKPTATPKPSEDDLPQTGMLRWPIPVLGVGGLLLFSLGWALCFMKKGEKKDDA